MDRLSEIIRRSTHWLSLVGFVGLFLLAIMSTLDALMRSFFSAPIHGVNDVSAVVMAVVIASCIPANLSGRKNITVEVLGAAFGLRADRVLRLFASIVVLVFVSLMAWEFVPYTKVIFESGRQTWVLAWPIWPWWSVATVFLAFAALVQAVNVAQDIRLLLSPLRVVDETTAIEPTATEEPF
ncbi:TRAP transporter small permease [Oricola sp.]|uniref:TRAP transporter small permease n=1 Tax=Oricola sp. TaxID=1979950 RepID=UPI00355A16D9